MHSDTARSSHLYNGRNPTDGGTREETTQDKGTDPVVALWMRICEGGLSVRIQSEGRSQTSDWGFRTRTVKEA